MAAWAAKRFWKAATAEACDGGFTVRLDGRPVKTPAKALLVLPTLAMAQAIAAEWDTQQGTINPEAMPLTRAANSAIDKVAPLRQAVIDELSGYGGTDLLCYRATDPAALIDLQAAAWDPLLDWAAEVLQAPLKTAAGVMYIAQPDASLARLQAKVAAMTSFELAALHDLVAISGSLVLALAVTQGRISAEEAWAASRIDERWQISQWGEDEEAAKFEALRHQAFLQADRFFGLCR